MWSRNFFSIGKFGRGGSATGDDDATPHKTTPLPASPLPEAIANAQARGQVYIFDLPADIDPARKLLERYSGIRAKNVDEHIHTIRDKLWEIYPHVCVGHFRFLSLQFTSDPHYGDALRRLQRPGSDAAFLDVGCCVGQVLRQLALDGADSRRLYGVDVEEGFVQAGYELFRDRDKLKATFVVGDLLLKSDEDCGSLKALEGKMTIVHAMSFFHLFGWDAQVRAAARIVGFLRPDDPDVVIFGRHVGTSQPGGGGGGARPVSTYLHNAETWQKLWNEVGELTGTRWRTEVEFLDRTDINMGGLEGAVRRLRFAVFRA
ncbi:hypothetical protein MGN70_001205 [Eutypa lata]|nr:hypothetical protein MGN70_001205 [Eutypa lata]